jgi:tRNA(Arg) A34 adenosine deaminase TadA
MVVAADSASAAQEQFMRVALEMAERGMASGGPPVGACLVRTGQVVSRGHNSVIGELDITAHAEMVVIREACRKLRTLQLQGCVLYVTVQPCPMCLSACYYAGIREVVYGASIEALDAFTGNELCASPAELFAGRTEQPLLTAGVLADDSRALLQSWNGGGRPG